MAGVAHTGWFGADTDSDADTQNASPAGGPTSDPIATPPPRPGSDHPPASGSLKSPKRRRVISSGHQLTESSATDWWCLPMRRSIEGARKALGPQRRAVNVGTGCSGTESPLFALQALTTDHKSTNRVKSSAKPFIIPSPSPPSSSWRFFAKAEGCVSK